MKDAARSARVMYHLHRNDKRIWQAYKCRCGFFCTGTTAAHDKDLLHGRQNRRFKWREVIEDADQMPV